MNPNVTVKKLIDPESPYVPILCAWFYGWWGEAEGYSMQKVLAYVVHSLCDGRLPETHVLLVDNALAGVFQLSVKDVDVRPDIYPWLINVYIAEAFRGRGLMHPLMDAVKKAARDLGLEELYLFTRHSGLYERFGWSFVEEFETFIHPGDVERLYRLTLF